MNEEFIRILDDDINMGKNIVEKNDKQSCSKFHSGLVSKYAKIIDGFDQNLHSLFYDESKINCIDNIRIMVEKLELFRAMDYQNVYVKTEPGINIHNSNLNINDNTIDINVSFEHARETIEKMTSLPDAEIEEIILKMNELEQIVKSTERKTKKWDKAKGIIKWIADKGVDVGIAFLPLLLQIQ